MSQQIVAPRIRDLGALEGQLESWLGKQLPDAADIRTTNFTYPNGTGMSHETILFDVGWVENGHNIKQGLVVRIKPTANMVFPDDLFEQQYRIMHLLHEKQWLPVAKTFWFEQDEAILGAPFFVMQKLRGRVPVSRPPYAQSGWIADATPAQRARLWENGVRALASVQKVPVSEVQFLAGPGGARSGLEQEWDKYSRFVEWVSGERRWPILDAAQAHLLARWPKNQPAGLVWGGAELVNVMFDDNFEVVALMDWEQPSLGGALQDLAWWLYMSDLKHSVGSGRPHLEGMGTREDTIALWEKLTGISAEDIEWYEDFMALKIGCLTVSSANAWHGPTPDLSNLSRRLKLDVHP